jgi:hypothetical protein
MAPACIPRSGPLPIGAMVRAALSVSAVALSLPLAGCGGGASGFCNDYCDCVGCSDNEREDCVDDVEDSLDEADKAGCGGEADDVLSCYRSELECLSGDRVDLDGCDAEEDAFSDCADGSVSIAGAGDPCQELLRALENGGCGSGQEQVECSGQSEIAARCYLASVSDICSPSQEELDAYSECVS